MEKPGEICNDSMSQEYDKCVKLMSAVPGVVCQLEQRDGAMVFAYCSAAAMDVCGFPASVLMEDATEFWTCVHAEDLQAVFAALLRAREPVTVEFRYWHPQRGLLWLEGRFVPTVCLGGQLLLHGVIIDISERKQLEQSLLESEAQYKWLFTQMRQQVSVHDIVQDEHGKVVDFVFADGNKALEDLLGLSMAELRGKSIRYVNPNVPMDMIEALGKVALTGEPLAQNYYSARLEKHFQVVSYSPRRGRFVSIHTDVTEWRRAEDALREANNVLKALNEFSLEQMNCLTQAELASIVTRQLYDYIKPMAVGYSLYDPVKRIIRLGKLHADPADMDRVVSVVGPGFLQVEIPVHDDAYARLTVPGIQRRETLYEATGGTISKEFAAAIQTAAGIGYLVVVPLTAEGVLYGSLIVALRAEAPVPSFSFLEQFAHLASITLRRLQAEERLRHISLHDQLTGLFSRHYFEHAVSSIDVAENCPCAVIMVDLNGLKAVNDTYGHARGDEILLAVAAALQDTCRPQDMAIRWGGDEFLLLLPRTDAATADVIAEEITARCHSLDEGQVPVTVAIGVASKMDLSQKLSVTISDAEDAMYKNKLAHESSARSGVLSTLLKILEEKSYETQLHSTRMQEAALAVASAIKLPSHEAQRLKLAILLHDIGKINVPEELLVRKGPLNDQEWRQMKRHPEVGSRIARSTPVFSHVAEEIMSHHERWDGTGYPHGLKGEEIPLLARIISIVDAYEVMSHGRPYKVAMSREAIIAEFQRCSGTHFDPALVQAFLRHIHEVM